ncbi:hypothetical protein [Microbacterium sp. gxy059]|uniref:hypothetical protein n=1 Tax=Microbacterium sp. gxy059 TaxID=2957199 RepID=UPI003D983CA8
MTSIRARAAVESGGWIEVPELADAQERDRWSAAVVDAVSRAHAERFDPDAAPSIQELVGAIADARADSDLLLLAFLPTRGPVAATVSVTLVEPEPVERWREAGYALSSIRTDHLGEGMLATRAPAEVADGRRLVGHECMFAFVDGDACVVVRVPPTAPPLFERMQPGLAEIVRSLVVEFDDGRAFVGRPIAGLPDGAADAWQIGTHDAA